MLLTQDQLNQRLEQAKQRAIEYKLNRARDSLRHGFTVDSLSIENGGLCIPFRPRLKVFKGCSGKVTFNPLTGDAYSFGWWRFVKVIDGRVVFNNYDYSVTTRGHQWRIRDLLNELGIEIDFVINMPHSLDDELFYSTALEFFYGEIYKARNKLTRTISYKKYYQTIINSCTANIKRLRRVGCTYNKVRQKQLKSLVERNIEDQLKRNRERRKAKTAI